jgi:hypothetical protein
MAHYADFVPLLPQPPGCRVVADNPQHIVGNKSVNIAVQQMSRFEVDTAPAREWR